MIELNYHTQSPKMHDQLRRCGYRHEHWICSLKTITHSSCDHHPHNDFCILVTRVHENWINSLDRRTPCSKSRYLPDLRASPPRPSMHQRSSPLHPPDIRSRSRKSQTGTRTLTVVLNRQTQTPRAQDALPLFPHRAKASD
jgi:hypothetical protein